MADYIAINFSSPNTPGLRDLQAAEPAARLLASLKSEQSNLAAETGRHVPIFMKVAPDVTDEHIAELSRVFWMRDWMVLLLRIRLFPASG